MQYRQGDLFIEVIADAGPAPAEQRQRRNGVILVGEATGHAHRVEDPSGVILWEAAGNFLLRVVADFARLVHEEHKPIALPRGDYRLWRQREYAPPPAGDDHGRRQPNHRYVRD